MLIHLVLIKRCNTRARWNETTVRASLPLSLNKEWKNVDRILVRNTGETKWFVWRHVGCGTCSDLIAKEYSTLLTVINNSPTQVSMGTNMQTVSLHYRSGGLLLLRWSYLWANDFCFYVLKSECINTRTYFQKTRFIICVCLYWVEPDRREAA
jgi:hypothetical protein